MKIQFFAICALLASCGGGSADFQNGMIVFDNSTDYPTTDLRLSDVAEITYIPLKGMDEGFLVSSLNNKGNNIDIDGDEIYLKEATVVYVYDMAGNPLRKLDKVGRGPEEYTYVNSLWVEPENNSVYVYGGQDFLEFDTAFEFKRRGAPTPFLLHSVVPINDSKAIADNKWQFDPEYASYYLIDKSDWSLEALPVELERPYVHDFDGILEHPSLIYGQDGVFMCNMRSDTIRWMDRNLKISPRMVDKTNYGKPDIMAVPSFETDDYVFFSLVFSPVVNPDLEERMFVFDKAAERIFRVPASENRAMALTMDELWLTCRNTTLNSGYAVALYQAINLIDNIDTLSPELRAIAETLEENDNPVMALIKLK